MKAYALVYGPRRKVLCVSDSLITLWIFGPYFFRDEDRLPTESDRRFCTRMGAYVVRIEYQLGAPVFAKRDQSRGANE